jgi:hypothetical protein
MSDLEMSHNKPSDSPISTDKTNQGLNEAGSLQDVLSRILSRLDSMEVSINDIGHRVSILESPKLKRDSWQDVLTMDSPPPRTSGIQLYAATDIKATTLFNDPPDRAGTTTSVEYESKLDKDISELEQKGAKNYTKQDARSQTSTQVNGEKGKEKNISSSSGDYDSAGGRRKSSSFTQANMRPFEDRFSGAMSNSENDTRTIIYQKEDLPKLSEVFSKGKGLEKNKTSQYMIFARKLSDFGTTPSAQQEVKRQWYLYVSEEYYTGAINFNFVKMANFQPQTVSIGAVKYMEIGRVFTRIFVPQESFPSSLNIAQDSKRILTPKTKIKDIDPNQFLTLARMYSSWTTVLEYLTAWKELVEYRVRSGELNLKKFKNVEISNSNLHQYYSTMVQYLDIIKEENRALIIMQEENAENDYETVRPAFWAKKGLCLKKSFLAMLKSVPYLEQTVDLVERDGEPVDGVAQTRDFKDLDSLIDSMLEYLAEEYQVSDTAAQKKRYRESMQSSVESINMLDFDGVGRNDQNRDENFFIAKTVDSDSDDESDAETIYEIRDQEKHKSTFQKAKRELPKEKACWSKILGIKCKGCGYCHVSDITVLKENALFLQSQTKDRMESLIAREKQISEFLRSLGKGLAINKFESTKPVDRSGNIEGRNSLLKKYQFNAKAMGKLQELVLAAVMESLDSEDFADEIEGSFEPSSSVKEESN